MRWLSGLLVILICLVAMALPTIPAQAQGTTIYLSPSSGVPGQDVTVYGLNFTPNKNYYVDIYYDVNGDGEWADDEWMVDARTDNDGNFQVDFEVPSSYKGTHTILAREATSGYVAEVDFTVKPGLTVDPEDGHVGNNITVEGHGFAKNETSIELRYYPGSSYETVAENIKADENGSWQKTFSVPSSAQGAHRIDAMGESSAASAVHDTTFEVTPAISIIDPASNRTIENPSGSPGQNMTMTGSGFYANDRYIKILFEGEEAQTEIIRTDDNGYWQGNFEVPEMPIGTYGVTAKGDFTPEGDITSLSFEIRPGIALSPDEGHVGTDLTITGYGFPVNEDVNITYDGSSIETTETDDNGSFDNVSFVVPESQHGERQVTAEDAAGNNATAIFTMESTPPDTPELKSPADGSRVGFIGKVRPTFNWSVVSDDSGVYYSLQIATSANVTTDGNFTDPLVSVTGIVGTNYTLNATEALPYGTYYWIVQAVDGAENAGNWTAASSFHAGFLPLWAFIVIIVAIVALIGTLVYFFVIRKRIYYY
jgi:hypothetical protein